MNYIADFIPNIRILCKPLYKRLRKNPPEWEEQITRIIKEIKQKVKILPCLGIPQDKGMLIVETDASDEGYGGILKQIINNKKVLIRYYSGIWNGERSNYLIVKKEVLAIVLCVNAFQDDLFNKQFLIRVDCQSVKFILEKDVKNLVSK